MNETLFFYKYDASFKFISQFYDKFEKHSFATVNIDSIWLCA